MFSKPFISLTIAAVLSLIALVAVRAFHLPTGYLWVVLLLWLGSVLLILGWPRSSSPSLARFDLWWSWRGAVLWLGGILAGTGIVATIDVMTGHPMTWETWSQLALGFILAYILGFILYQFATRLGSK